MEKRTEADVTENNNAVSSTSREMAGRPVRDMMERDLGGRRAEALHAVNVLKEVYEQFAACGGEAIRIAYSGSGEEGRINETSGVPVEVWTSVAPTTPHPRIP